MRKLEAKYPRELVVIGIHSPKFPAEKRTENLRRAVFRHRLEHPVVNDADMVIWQRWDVERNWQIVETVGRVAQARGTTCAQVALNWVLQKPGVGSIIVAARNEAQMEEILRSAEWQMTPEETARLDALSEPERIYPYVIPTL